MSRDTPFDDQIDYRHLSQAPYKRPRVEDDDINECKDGTGTSGLRLPSRYVSCDEKRVLQPRSNRAFATPSSDSLTSKQRRLISQWNIDFREPTKDDDVWPDEHLTALATAIRATPQIVVDFIRQQQLLSNTEAKGALPHKSSSVPSSERAGSYPPFGSYDLPGANAHLPSTILTLVDKYVSACRRRRSQTDGRRSVNKGPYRCTFGCGYCTKRAFDWRRHEETHEPQELWLCELCCQKDALNPFLVNRRDKFLRHAMDKHAGYSAENVLEMSKVQFVPRAAEGCPFCDDEVAKGWSWEERCRHVLGHFEDEVEKSKKKPVIVKGREDSYEEEDRRSTSGSDESAGSNEEEQ